MQNRLWCMNVPNAPTGMGSYRSAPGSAIRDIVASEFRVSALERPAEHFVDLPPAGVEPVKEAVCAH